MKLNNSFGNNNGLLKTLSYYLKETFNFMFIFNLNIGKL